MTRILLAAAFLILPVIAVAAFWVAFQSVWSRRPRPLTAEQQFHVDWASSRFAVLLAECFERGPADVIWLEDRRRAAA